MTDLERELFALGEHLDHPSGDDLVERVTSRLREDERGDDAPGEGPRTRRAWLFAAAAAIVLLLLGVVAFAPTRDAIAGWLGIGAVEVRQIPSPAGSTTSVPRSPGPGTAEPSDAPGGSLDPIGRVAFERTRRELQERVAFTIRVPSPEVAPAPVAAELDEGAPGGLVELRYEGFSLIEVASDASESPVIMKQTGPEVRFEYTEVDGHEALWLSGDPHEVAYRSHDGTIRTDTVRRAGNVLVWVDGGVTFRIEGAPDLAAAKTIATSLR